jgi:SAM-dependent methyltransferase
VTGATDPDAVRDQMRAGWQRVAAGWSVRREWIRSFGMPVSRAMIDAVEPQPGERLLELAAGVGDTGFLAAELLRPGGTLVCSDASEAMLEAARARARELGIDNVEFAQLELEWIDLPTASVDGALCRYGLMFAIDRGAALRELRRVLRPGGRVALAVWDEPEHNPWATAGPGALVNLGLVDPPDPTVPGMFALASPGMLADLLHEAGFIEVSVSAVGLEASYDSIEAYMAVERDCSRHFGDATVTLEPAELDAVRREIETLVAPFAVNGGPALRMPGRALVASAGS